MNIEIKDCIGKQFKDKKWGDTVIEIVAISGDLKDVRFKWIKIRGNDMIQDKYNITESSVRLIEQEYTLV